MAACSQNVPTGPSTATRCGASRAKQADMISRQMAATCWFFSGPGLSDWIFSSTCATRSGRKNGEPSARLMSPTASAKWARWFSSCSSWPSSWSICTRRSARVGLTPSVMGCRRWQRRCHPLQRPHRHRLGRRFPRCAACPTAWHLRPNQSASHLVWHGPFRGFH